ncbi:hypothetical protein M5D96_005854, partial [Drosophila gunungcola]
TPTGSGCSTRPARTATPRLSERKRQLFGSPVSRLRKIKDDDEDEDVDSLGVLPLKPHVAANKQGRSLFAADTRKLRSSTSSSGVVVAATAEQLPHLFTTTMRLNSNSSSNSRNSSPRTPKIQRKRADSSMSSPSSCMDSPSPRRERANPSPMPEIRSSCRRSPRRRQSKVTAMRMDTQSPKSSVKLPRSRHSQSIKTTAQVHTIKPKKKSLASSSKLKAVSLAKNSDSEDENNPIRSDSDEEEPTQKPTKRVHPDTFTIKTASSAESDSGSPQSKMRKMTLKSSIPTMAFYSHSGASATNSPTSRQQLGINKGVSHKIRKSHGLPRRLPATDLNNILNCLSNERLKNLITTKREERAKVEEVHQILRSARDPIKMAKPLKTMWQETSADFSDLSEDEDKVVFDDPVIELEPIIPLIRHEPVQNSTPAEPADLSKRKFFKSGRRSSTCMEVRITDNIRASVSQVRVKSATIFSAEQATVDAILKNLNDSMIDEIVESKPMAVNTPMDAEDTPMDTEPLSDIIEYAPETIDTEIDPFARLPYQTDDPDVVEQQQILLEFLISNNICTEENFEIFIANPDNHKEEANRIVDDLYMVVNSEEAAQMAQMEALPEQKSTRRRPDTSSRLLSAAAGGSNQYQIDAGQKAFGARQCQQCGLVYTVHEPEEEQLHREYHNSIHVLRFKGWIDEDIVAVYPELERLRDLIGVVDKELGYSSYIVPKIFVAFLAVRKQQIVGFCLVQPLSQAHRFIQVDGVDYFSEESYPASCGISRIWVSPLQRRSGIASKLLRVVQCHTVLGQEIAKECIAFSTPTDNGRALARQFTGLDNFLTYDHKCEERKAYEKNPYFTGHIYGNFSPFYVTIAICTVVLGTIIILNIILGCCSKHRKYWQDRHTGNRWLPTTHQQVFPDDVVIGVDDLEPVHSAHHHHQQQHQRPPRPEGRTLHQQRQREEYVELQKRESDI